MMNPVPWLQMTNMISYQGLVRTFPNVNAAQRFDEILLNYRTGGEKDTDGVINFVTGSSIKKTTLKTLTPDEYRVLKQFLTVI